MQTEQFKAKFIEEAYSLINQLEESLLDQEENKDNKENVQHIFRVMHTLKGVSSMYGFHHIGDLAHDLETILDLIREGKQEFTHDIFEVTLKTVDQFRNLLEDEKLEKEGNQIKQQEVLSSIEEIVKATSIQQPEKGTSKQKEKPCQEGMETFYIIFHPTENMLFRGVNILNMFEDLAGLGEYKIINHNFKEHHPDKQDQNAWGVYVVSNQGIGSIESIFMFVMDDCRIVKISDTNLFCFEEFNVKIESLKKAESTTRSSDTEIDLNGTIESINEQTKQAELQTNDEVKEKEQKEELSIEKETRDAGDNQNEKTRIEEESKYTDVGKQLTQQISIDASKLDRLMYLVSELVTTKSELNLVVERKDYTRLISVAEKIDELSRNFRDNALNIRLVPVSDMIMPYKRMIRDLSKSLGKEVKLITQGIETELDKNVIDRLAEPIMHILRNCVDHGIETPDVRVARNKAPEGSIKFTSFYSGANVFIQIQDDGAGIDPEKIRQKAIEKGLIGVDDNLKEKQLFDLLFHPGFSTAEQVTEVSGRGVGMDVVRKKINEVRGEVEINSELGLGTFITIKLHQTMSIIDTLLLKVDDEHYLVPVSDIEFCEQERHQVLYKNQNRQVEIADELMPFISLRDIFNHGHDYPEKEKMVVINKNDKRVAILADKIVGEHQAVLKPLGDVFQSQQFLSGASMLGDGTLALMLDTNKLVNKTLVEVTV